MRNYSMLLLLALSVNAGTYVHAQEQEIGIEVDNEIDQMYNSTQTKKATAQPHSGAVVTQTIIVPQQSQQSLQSVQKQPTTLIEASPLSDSRADMIRKNRQEEEMRTESRIVEKLEQSRMEDEKKRATVLFGDKFETMQTTQTNVSAPAAVQAPPQALAPVTIQPVYIEPKEELSRDAVREEVRAALKEEETAVSAPVVSKYFAGLAGIGEYPDVNNVKGNYSLGAAFGTRYDYFLVEGAFFMSNYSVDMNNMFSPGAYRTDNYEVNQYQGIISAKYQLLGGVVRPVLGGLVSYSYRKFTLTNSYTNASQDTGNSHAIDLGIVTGVDLELSPKFSLGMDLKYMFNMSSRVNSNYSNSTYARIGTPIEKLQYYIAGIAARVNF
ncbi:MAG: hypothetical protein H7328_02240 [Bdellovibrio sp.]|nr:hypothetical protein [Bdellovibrio sp.]